MPRIEGSIFQRVIRWRYLIVINLIIATALGVSLGREVVRNTTIDAEIAALQADAEELMARNIEMSELKTAMQTESYIEREARLKLGMKKPGEQVVVVQMGESQAQEFTGDESDPLGMLLTVEDSKIVVANPGKWWYYFFDKQRFSQL